MSHIEHRDGTAYIGKTRIAVWHVIRAIQLGSSKDDILASYPTLTIQNIDDCLHYYIHNSDEIEREIEENETA